MKKLLLSLVAMVFAIGVNAQTEAFFDFDNNATDLFGIEGRSSNDSHDGDITETTIATLNGVSLTVSPADEGVSNANRLWYTAPTLRMYSGTLTVAAPGHKITKIVFKGHSSNFNITANNGTLEGKNWTASEEVAEVVFAVAKNTQINTITVTLDGEIGGEPDVFVPAGTGEGTVESPYDVTRAIDIIANDKAASTNVYVKGIVTRTQEWKDTYTDLSYWISVDGTQTAELQVYRGKHLGGENFTADNLIEDGDEVVVYGKLIDFNGTPEVAQGSKIHSLNGQTYTEPETPPYEAVGNGSKENPYTVADVAGLNIEESDGNKYWVKGYILGSATSKDKLNEADKAVDTNIALGATADATTFIPVAIPAGDLRSVLGVATNPNNVGKEVLVYGTLEKYFSTAGVKNVTDCIIDGQEHSTAINAATADNAVNGAAFNLAGQKVSSDFRGIVVKNGKKIVK